MLGNYERPRASHERRRTKTLEDSDAPIKDYAHECVVGACYENIVARIPVPLGIAGPLDIDGEYARRVYLAWVHGAECRKRGDDGHHSLTDY